MADAPGHSDDVHVIRVDSDADYYVPWYDTWLAVRPSDDDGETYMGPSRVPVSGLEGLRGVCIVDHWLNVDGHRVDPGELIACRDDRLIEGGWLRPLSADVLAWECPEGRLWATLEAIRTHGCCEVPPGRVAASMALDTLPPPECLTPDTMPHGDLPPGLTGPKAEILRRWRAGDVSSEIATAVGYTTKTIENRIYELRRDFGPSWVPRRRALGGRDHFR